MRGKKEPESKHLQALMLATARLWKWRRFSKVFLQNLPNRTAYDFLQLALVNKGTREERAHQPALKRFLAG